MSDDLPVLRPEEDEPDFRALLNDAKARAMGGDQLVTNLLEMIYHLYGEIDALENHISDYGPACEDDDDPAYMEALLAEISAARTNSDFKTVLKTASEPEEKPQ